MPSAALPYRFFGATTRILAVAMHLESVNALAALVRGAETDLPVGSGLDRFAGTTRPEGLQI